MRGRTLTFRFVALLVSLLIVYPTLFAFFVQSSSFSDGLRTSFLLFKQPLLAILAMTLFFLFAKSGRGDRSVAPTLSKWREFSGFFLMGTLCLALSAITQVDLNQILNSGISIHNKKVHWDAQRWGGLPFLSESDPVGEQYLWVRTPDQRLMKEIRYPIPSPLMGEGQGGGEKTTLKWYGLWQDGNSNGVLDDQVWLSVDGQRYDVTEQYRKIPSQTPQILMLSPSHFLSGSSVGAGPRARPNDNQGNHGGLPLQLILSKDGSADRIGWVGQTSYLTGQTREWKMPAGGGSASGGESGKWINPDFMEAMVWVDRPNGTLQTLLFKLGFLLRWGGMILLFLAFFGRRWVMGFVKQSPGLAAISLAYAPVVLLLGVGLRQIWPWMAQGIGWSLYGLLKLGFSSSFIDITDSTHVKVGTADFSVNIADTCSGIESIGLFAGIYLGLILFNYRRLRLGRALFLIVPGLLGMYLVNLCRVYLLFLIGLTAGNAALDLFHTYLGMVLFVLYFLFFWQRNQGWILKEVIPRAKFHAAPGMISGALVFFLMSGYQMTAPLEQSIAICTWEQYKVYQTTGCSSGGSCVGETSPYCFNRYEVIGVCGIECILQSVTEAPPPSGCHPWGNTYSTVINRCVPIPEFPTLFPFLAAFLMPFLKRLRFYGSH